MTESFPQYSKQLSSIINRLYDLMVPFRKKYYYTPAMKGSYSIKKITCIGAGTIVSKFVNK